MRRAPTTAQARLGSVAIKRGRTRTGDDAGTTEARVPDAVQRDLGAAPQSRDPCLANTMGPGSAVQHAANAARRTASGARSLLVQLALANSTSSRPPSPRRETRRPRG